MTDPNTILPEVNVTEPVMTINSKIFALLKIDPKWVESKYIAVKALDSKLFEFKSLKSQTPETYEFKLAPELFEPYKLPKTHETKLFEFKSLTEGVNPYEVKPYTIDPKLLEAKFPKIYEFKLAPEKAIYEDLKIGSTFKQQILRLDSSGQACVAGRQPSLMPDPLPGHASLSGGKK